MSSPSYIKTRTYFKQETQHPILAHAPNLSFHSCLYFSHHSSSHVWRVSPQTMILNRACSSAVQATPSNSPFVTGAWLRSRPAEASNGKRSKQSTLFISKERESTDTRWWLKEPSSS